ncbi:hypothetical protein BDV93DRAFT_606495 [Ceratobasidium sp. AG-I]|nr:hypothetical protein BDV93DRAFT_606495 [Ceratobasidium sp. AG-I]
MSTYIPWGRILKRRYSSSDSDGHARDPLSSFCRQLEAERSPAKPAKQARVDIENTHVRRLPALRRSDSTALDINASEPVLDHLPPNHSPVSVPSNLVPREGDQDMAGSTDSESQDEAGAWDRRAQSHRHAALFKRPREPAPKIKSRTLGRKVSEVALLDGSDSDSDEATGSGGAGAERTKKLVALRAGRAKAMRTAPGVKVPVTRSTAVKATGLAPPMSIDAVPGTTTTTTVSRKSSTTTITTVVSNTVQPTQAPPARPIAGSSRLRGQKAPARSAALRPQRQASRSRQAAINAIAGGSNDTATPVPTPAPTQVPTPLRREISTLSSMGSIILRRNRRNQQAAPQLD